MIKKLLLISIVFAITACDSNRVFEDAVMLKEREWIFNAPIEFTFPIDDPSQQYNVSLYLRYTNEFRTTNFYFRYTLEDSLNNRLSEGLNQIDLFESKSGRPLGDSGIGDIFEIKAPLLEQYSFKDAGNYTVSFNQFMRVDTLKDVVSAGVRVELAN